MLRDFRNFRDGPWGVVRSLFPALHLLRFQHREVLLKNAADLEDEFMSPAFEFLHVIGDYLALLLRLHQHLLGLAFGCRHNRPCPLLPTTDQFLCGLLSSHQGLLPTVLLLPYALDL